jgi:CRP-like cAMP-binding protein
MSEYLTQLNKYLLQFVPLTDSQLLSFNDACNVVHVPKGTVIIHANQQQQFLYFICKGIVRSFIVTEDGTSKTYNFRMENMTSTGYFNYNYKNDLKAIVNVECLEDSVLVKVPMTLIKHVVEDFKYGDRMGRFIAEAHVIELVNFIVDRDTKTLLDRYQNLEFQFPNIHQRVPQHMIASYLGTTPVHLSRIKKSRKRSLTNVNSFS